MKYLVIKCEELSDQWECDATRTPLCMTDDISAYGRGYEIYELQADSSFKLVKEYHEYLEAGIAIYEYFEDKPPIVFEKFRNLDRNKVTKSSVKRWKEKYHFADTINQIYNEIGGTGAHSEIIIDKDEEEHYIVIGEYEDNHYDSGY